MTTNTSAWVRIPKEDLPPRAKSREFVKEDVAPSRGNGCDEEENGEETGFASVTGSDVLWKDLMVLMRHPTLGVPIRDRWYHFRRYKDCFEGTEAVAWMQTRLKLTEDSALELGEELMRRRRIEHVTQSEPFCNLALLYRFLDEPPLEVLNLEARWVWPCRRPLEVVESLREQCCAAAVTHVDSEGLPQATAIERSAAWEEFLLAVGELQAVDLNLCTTESERTAFFLQLHALLCLHASITLGIPDDDRKRALFFGRAAYQVGSYAYSLDMIAHGMLRAGRTPRHPRAIPLPVLAKRDARHRLMAGKVDWRVHCALVDVNLHAPYFRAVSAMTLESDLERSAHEYFRNYAHWDPARMLLTVPEAFSWYAQDLGAVELLDIVARYLPGTSAEILGSARGRSTLVLEYSPLPWNSMYFRVVV